MFVESIKIQPRWRLEKWERPQHLEAGDPSCVSAEQAHALGLPPDEVIEWDGNLLLTAGAGLLIDRLCGLNGPPTALDNTNARMYVGNGTAAAAAGQTDLQGATKVEKAMDVGFPVRSGNVATWKATYGTTEANIAWEEGGVKNGAGVPNGTSIILFNRKVQTLGTKASGAVWTLTLEITFT